MKKTLLIFSLIVLNFSLASAQSVNWWKPSANHKILLGTGHNSRISEVDTGKLGQVLVSQGNADPIWKTQGSGLRLTADTLTTSTSVVYTPLQFNAADTQSYYRFDIEGLDTSSSSAGMKFYILLPSGATIKAKVNGQTTGVSAMSYDVITASATATIAYATATSTNNGAFRITGVVHTASTAGIVALGLSKTTSGTAGILANSYITWSKF